MLCLCPYWFKYDGSWMNGRLSGPVNMILPNHVYLGTFYDSLVSINSYEMFGQSSTGLGGNDRNKTSYV